MPLHLTEADVQSILTMPMALDLVESSFGRLAEGKATLQYRQRLVVPEQCVINHMAGADNTTGYMGLKIYSIAGGVARFLVTLYEAKSGELIALIEADYLGQARTGAASGVATKFMAREDASIAAIIGTGLQACTQLEAIAPVRKLRAIRAYGRDAARREAFAKKMAERLGIPVTAAASAEEAVRGAHIVSTATTSKEPVLLGKWLEPGTHVNAIGVNQASKRELDSEAVLRADFIAADSPEQSKIEAGDLIQAFGHDAWRWDSVQPFADVVGGTLKARTNGEQITLFKSIGVATEDIVVAGRVYEIARERKMGKEVRMWEKDTRSLAERGI
jgi:ornithine cyclodeaminase/alanine dehydrogenase-like protein (mu-crystallin family)